VEINIKNRGTVTCDWFIASMIGVRTFFLEIAPKVNVVGYIPLLHEGFDFWRSPALEVDLISTHVKQISLENFSQVGVQLFCAALVIS